MKSEKGVTLVSLTIYIIAMVITVTIITIVTSYFYKNVDVTGEKYTYFAEFTRFESYFSEESNQKGNRILEVSDAGTQTYLALSSGNQYTYIPANKAIYQNNVKIASGVEQCTFTEKTVNGNEAIEVKIKIQGRERTIQYVLKN